MNDTIVSIFQCPITATPLQLMRFEELESLNQSISARKVFHPDGSEATKIVSAALVTADKKLKYGIYDGIISLLPSLVLIDNPDAINLPDISPETQIIRQFYDQIGWKKADEKQFSDAAQFEDLRPVMRSYIHNCHKRLAQHLPPSGTFLLDIASGPIQYDEYLTYSEQYDYRICADISAVALQYAQLRLKTQKGIFVLCDITNLPFKTGVCDTFVSLHTIYHVAAAQQLQVIGELNRVLKNGKTGVIVYSWGQNALLMRFLQPGLWFKKTPKPKLESSDSFYFYAFPPNWFDSSVKPLFNVELFCWRSIATGVAKRFIHSWLLGSFLLRGLFFLENRLPRFFGRFGQYPIWVFKKQIEK